MNACANVSVLMWPQAGVAKLNEAKALVDELKRRAAEQSSLLKTKQAEADAALQEITTSMQVCVWDVCGTNKQKCPSVFTCGAFQNASDQKTEMEKIKERMAHEVSKIEERKKKIDEELREVQVSTPVWLTWDRVLIG